MANPTTYFGWVMPTSSSLVTNLPADFNTFGQGVDTSLQDLLGGTTGQVLSKTSATNMDFTWVTPTDQTPLTTKGDLFTFSTVDARLGVGTNGQYLKADSTASTGLSWATLPSSGKVLQVLQTTFATQTSSSSTTYADTGLTGTITPSSATSKIMVILSMPIQKSAGNSQNGIYLNIVRGASQILEVGHVNLYTGTTLVLYGIATYNYLDSPATTSATTYKVQFKNEAAAAAVEFCPGNKTATMILMEIGA
jgi:predicted secreted protein